MGLSLSYPDIIMDHLLVNALSLLPKRQVLSMCVDDLMLTLPDDKVDITLEILNRFNEHI